MKLGILVNNQAVIEKISKLQVSGKIVFQLRKTIKTLTEEIRIFEEARNAYITEHGKLNNKTGQTEIVPGTKLFNEFVKYLNEMADSVVDDPSPVFSESDLHLSRLSVQELDSLYTLGLIKSEPVSKQKKTVKEKTA